MIPPARGYRARLTISALVLAGAAGLTVLVRSVLSSLENTCEVCVTRHGRTICREAVGHTEELAIRIAGEYACEFLSAGAADRADCLDTPPDSVRCEQARPASPESP